MFRIHAAISIHIILLIVLALLCIGSSAQYEVTGTLVDPDQDPVSGLSVMLFNEKDEQIATDITDDNGEFTLVYQVEPTSADPQDGSDIPSEFKLGSSYPNPFNPTTTVPFHVPERTQAVISIYNILGQRLLSNHVDISAGSNEIQVNLGGNFSQGQYIIRVQGEGYSLAQSMTFLSAGIGGGASEITVRQGGQRSNRIYSSMQQMDRDMGYRVVVKETQRYQSKEVTIASLENLDTGTLVLTTRQEDSGDWPRDTETEVVDVTNPVTGRIWMDRNLGASRAAISSTDSLAYGDLYQWGRAADGHQKRDSDTTSTASTTDQPGHGNFILSSDDNRDWRNPQNDDLWQGVNGVNNPCPAGYRLPTDAEWNAELNSWSSSNASGAFQSPLKLPLSGSRARISSSIFGVGTEARYWSSTVYEMLTQFLYVFTTRAGTSNTQRTSGYSVRCIKSFYTLELGSSPWWGGSVSGAAEYYEGDEFTITAMANSGYVFVNWSGDIDYIADENAANTTLTMPARNIRLMANFEYQDDNGDDGGRPWDTETKVVDVTNPLTGRVWMDRNLGASRAATSSTDSLAYGDLYQWGRGVDGHQRSNSSITSTLSSSDQPGHGSFILSTSEANRDWRRPQNDNLWQGVKGINNPCPAGYRLPTVAEWNAERESWSSNNTSGAFNSPLKLPMAGYRSSENGSLLNVGSHGRYWSSSVFVFASSAWNLYFVSGNASMRYSYRASGCSVRCVKD
ncbi:FISUMP domain-containing protein [Balneolaceae bacterium ANBcel3]|nr:FISUMP domain-containing protein [Balneolaceae bacterium ANBcel3]